MRIKLTRGLIVIGNDGREYECEATEYPARRLSSDQHQIEFCSQHQIGFRSCGEVITAVVSSEFVQELSSA
jgi:hypothetical protein